MAQPCDFPVNIDTSVKAENCNITCNYKYDYNDSSCIVNSLGWRLNINYDLKSDGTKPQAFLNDKKFNVKEIRVLTPSKNTYNGVRSDIEVVIYHQGGSDGKEQLMVTIPFVVSASTTLKQGGLILDNIINTYVKQTAGQSVQLLTSPTASQQININNFNLNNFIPNTPYYYYKVNTPAVSSPPREACNQHNIIFDMLKSGQTISQTAVDKLNTLLSPASGLYSRNQRIAYYNEYAPVTTQTLYLNSNGPNYQGQATDNKIYIDCQPTDKEGEGTTELYKKQKEDIGKDSREQGVKMINTLMESGSVQFILAIVIGLIVISIGKRAFMRS